MDPLATPHKIAVAGDWHSNTSWALRMIAALQDQHVDTILHVGDFGLWESNWNYMPELEKQLAERDTMLLWVDGNHEDHLELAHRPIEDNGLRWFEDHIWHIPRGFRWEWDGIKFLGLGGAASVDEHSREEYVSWWRTETISLSDAERAVTGGEVDVMICHDCPEGVEIPELTKTADFWPEDTIRKSEANRQILRAVVDEVLPKVLFHGHYHTRYNAKLELPYDGDPVVQIVGLHRDFSSAEQNLVIMNLDEVLS